VKKPLVSTFALALAFGLSGAMLALSTGDALAQAKPKAAAKTPNHEAMMAPCRAATKDLYTGDQRVFTYGYCVSKLPHAGNQGGSQVARR
jgi:hypothetical protein